MEGQPEVTRRQFIRSGATSATAAGIAASSLAAPLTARAARSNERLGIGFIGPGGRGMQGHVKPLAKLLSKGAPINLVAVNDVYINNAQTAANYIEEATGNKPKQYDDYRELLADDSIDAVCIGTPDHWHAKQTIDALRANKHVYCEKPMTHSVQEAFEVVDAWRDTGKVMQVGVQSTSLPVWDKANELLRSGELGKVLMFQTEYFRNSSIGQWRYYKLDRKMTPKTINWRSGSA